MGLERSPVGRFSLVAMLREWRKDPMAALAWMSALPADISAPRFGYPMRIVLDAEVAGEVLVADAGSYTRPWLVTSTMRDGLGPTLFTSNGAEAMAQRRLLAPVFARAHSDELARLMSATIGDELAAWQTGPIPDLQGPLTDLTLRVAARALLGVDTADHDRGRRFRRLFGTIVDWISAGDLRPRPIQRRWPSRPTRRPPPVRLGPAGLPRRPIRHHGGPSGADHDHRPMEGVVHRKRAPDAEDHTRTADGRRSSRPPRRSVESPGPVGTGHRRPCRTTWRPISGSAPNDHLGHSGP
jgi:hypothetical protein